MGVSVRVSRNTRISLPFWLAIPVYLLVAAVWAAVVVIAGIPWCIREIVRARRASRR